jgi:hypothetical protein
MATALHEAADTTRAEALLNSTTVLYCMLLCVVRLRLIPESKPAKSEILLRILIISSADEPSRAQMVEEAVVAKCLDIVTAEAPVEAIQVIFHTARSWRAGLNPCLCLVVEYSITRDAGHVRSARACTQLRCHNHMLAYTHAERQHARARARNGEAAHARRRVDARRHLLRSTLPQPGCRVACVGSRRSWRRRCSGR